MNKKIIITILAIITLIAIAYYLLSPLFIVKTADDITPSGNAISSGVLVSSAHEVSGSVSVIGGGGQRILRFENLDTVNGPDLFIYLATDTTAGDFVNLGEIKATKGNVNYAIPAGTDLNKYDTVLIWCRAFRVLFSYAKLE